MTDSSPNRIRSERVFDGRIVKVDLDTVRAPDGTEMRLEMVRHHGAAAIVPLLSDAGAEDPSILLIKQYRYATNGSIWEIPAGLIDPGESPAECARRELREEVGAEAAELDYLTTIYTTPGFTDERIHIFLATGLTVGATHHEADEFIEVKALPLSRILEMIRDSELVDGKSVAALLYVAGFRLGM